MVDRTVEAACAQSSAYKVTERPVHVTNVLKDSRRVGSGDIVTLLTHKDLLAELGRLRSHLYITTQTVHEPAL